MCRDVAKKNTFFTEHLPLGDSPISVFPFRTEKGRHAFEEENEILQRNIEENSNNIVQNQRTSSSQ